MRGQLSFLPPATEEIPAAAVRPGDVLQVRDSTGSPAGRERILSVTTRWRRFTYAAPSTRAYYSHRTVIVTDGYRGRGTWLAPHAPIEVVEPGPRTAPRRPRRRLRGLTTASVR